MKASHRATLARTWSELLRERVRGPVLDHEPMASHTAFRIGGPADVLVIPESRDDLARALETCHRHGLPVTVIGRGSNLLVSDDGIEGVVIQIARGLSRAEFNGTTLEVEAGAPLPAMSWQAAMHGLSGLEFGVMIPGSVGGGIVMNAGAHHRAIGSVVESVLCFGPDGSEVRLSAEDLRFAYRHSVLQSRPDLAVVSARLQLAPRPVEAITAEMESYLEARRRTQPLGEPGAGSIFKNPPGDYAGRLIEQAGLKGWRRGDVEVSPIHANFIVNKGRATCVEMLDAIRMVRRRVQEAFGVTLELEVKVVGRFVSAPLE
ncbi:MAG: UDP-N-acetylmuramate dehydrogenase [Bacillota bacterium]